MNSGLFDLVRCVVFNAWRLLGDKQPYQMDDFFLLRRVEDNVPYHDKQPYQNVMFGILLAVLLPCSVFARTVAVDTYVCNPGQVVSVNITVDDLADAGAAIFAINYDSTIVACLGVDAGEAINGGKMTYADTGSGQIVLAVPEFNASKGVVARVRLFARAGTQGQFSDVTVVSADFGAKDGVTDLSTTNPIQVKNGMVRVVDSSASVSRLEAAFTVWPKTTARELTLIAGDGIRASDDGEGIYISQSVSATEVISVQAPLYGWQTGRYVLMTAPVENLQFSLGEGVDAVISFETLNGMTSYYADVTVEGSFEIVPEAGSLDAGTIAAIRASLSGELSAYPNVKRVVVKGDVAKIPVIIDLGIVPDITVAGDAATVEYKSPALKIVAFDPQTGIVRIKVTPAAGNRIRSQLVTGCIHVYGTDDLFKTMRYISQVSIDVADYLREGTKGEADLTVTMGTHTFLKVKAETQIKNEGDTEQ